MRLDLFSGALQFHQRRLNFLVQKLQAPHSASPRFSPKIGSVSVPNFPFPMKMRDPPAVFDEAVIKSPGNNSGLAPPGQIGI